MKVITSESVFRGHPDKVCDQISDAILDAVLKEDKNSRVAIECAIKYDLILLFGEITTNATVDYSSIAKQVIKDIGYEENFYVLERISLQSNDIALGVDVDGAGDQGIMYGYASNETQELMPLPIVMQDASQLRWTSLQDLSEISSVQMVSVRYLLDQASPLTTKIQVQIGGFIQIITKRCVIQISLEKSTIIFQGFNLFSYKK